MPLCASRGQLHSNIYSQLPLLMKLLVVIMNRIQFAQLSSRCTTVVSVMRTGGMMLSDVWAKRLASASEGDR